MSPNTFFYCTYAKAIQFAEENSLTCTESNGPNLYSDDGTQIKMIDDAGAELWVWVGEASGSRKGAALPGADSSIPMPPCLLIK